MSKAGQQIIRQTMRDSLEKVKGKKEAKVFLDNRHRKMMGLDPPTEE